MPVKRHTVSELVGHKSDGTKNLLQLDNSNNLKIVDEAAGSTLTDIETELTTANTTLSNIETNTANIKASIELGGDLYISQDEVEGKLDTVNTNLTTIEASLTSMESKQDDQETSLNSIETNTNDLVNVIGTTATAGPSKCLSMAGTEAGGNIREILVDENGHVQADIISGSVTATVAGVSTEAKQDVMETTLDAIEVNTNNLDTKLDHLSDNLDTLETSMTSIEGKHDTLETTANAIETNTNNLDTKLDHLSDNLDTLETSLTSMEGKQDDQETTLNAIETNTNDIVNVIGTTATAGPSKCLSMAGTEAGGNIREILVDSSGHVQADILTMPTTTIQDGGGSITVDNNVLTNLDAAINASKVDVNIASGGFDGVVSGTVTANAGTNLNTSALALESGGNLATIAGDTTSIDGKMTYGADASLTNAQQVLVYGKNGGALKPMHITNNGDVEVEIADFVKGQALMAASFPVVLSSDHSDISVALSSTDNTVLDNIDTNTSNIDSKLDHLSSDLDTLETTANSIETNTNDLVNVIGTTATAGPSKCLSMAGTEAGGNIRELLVDSSGHVQVDVLTMPTTTIQDGGGSITVDNNVLTNLDAAINASKVDVNIASGGFDGVVSGTVTANLSATDNTVLDNIDTNTSNIDSKLDHLSSDLDTVNTNLTTLETSANAVETNTNNIDTKLDHLSSDLDTVNTNLTSNLDVVADYRAWAGTTSLLASTEIIMSASNTTNSVTGKYKQPFSIMVKADTNSDWDYDIEESIDDTTYVATQTLLNSGPGAGQNNIYNLESVYKYWRVKITNGSTTQNFTVDYITV